MSERKRDALKVASRMFKCIPDSEERYKTMFSTEYNSLTASINYSAPEYVSHWYRACWSFLTKFVNIIVSEKGEDNNWVKTCIDILTAKNTEEQDFTNVETQT